MCCIDGIFNISLTLLVDISDYLAYAMSMTKIFWMTIYYVLHLLESYAHILFLYKEYSGLFLLFNVYSFIA